MSGWAPVRARKVVAAVRTERWSRAGPCPEALAEVQLACLLEVEELADWSLSKLSEHWGWSRKKATRVVLGWADWLEAEGPAHRRRYPGWLADLVERHRESADEDPLGDSEGTALVEEDQRPAPAEAPARNRQRTGVAPRARSLLLDRDDLQPQPANTALIADPEDKELVVFREWETRYRAFRNQHAVRQQVEPYAPTEERLLAIRGALRTADPETNRAYRPEDLILLVRYAYEAPDGAPDVDWWRKDRGRFLAIENLMAPPKLAARMQTVKDWAAGDLTSSGTQASRGRARPGRGAYAVAGQSADTPAFEARLRSEQDNAEAFERKRSAAVAAGGGG